MSKIEKLKRITQKATNLKGDVFLAKEFVDIEDNINEIKSSNEQLGNELNEKFSNLQEELKKKLESELVLEIDKEELKGEKGEPGENYILTNGDKKDIANLIDVPIVEKIIEKTEVIKEVPIVTNEIVEVAIPETAEELLEKLNSLSEDFKLSAKNVEWILPEDISIEIEGIKKQIKNGLGGSTARNLYQLQDVNVSGATNQQVLTYNSTTNLWEPGSGTGLIQWGEITGDQSLVNVSGFTNDAGYLTSETQTLQDVTDLGATTTNDITIDNAGVSVALNLNGSLDASFISSASNKLETWYNSIKVSDIDQNGATNFYNTITVRDSADSTKAIQISAAAQATDSTSYINSLATQSRSWNLPDASGTIALTSQLTPPGSNTSLIYNDFGATGGDLNITWDKTTRVFSVGDPSDANNGTKLVVNDGIGTIIGTAKNAAGTSNFAVNQSQAYILHTPSSGTSTWGFFALNGEAIIRAGLNNYVFPNTDGTSGQVLKTNGSGGLYFDDASAASTLADISSNSDDNTKSLYTMTTGVDVEFRNSSSIPLLFLDEANGRIGTNTNAPLSTLHVGNTDGITFGDGIAEAQTLLTVNNTDSTKPGLFWVEPNDVFAFNRGLSSIDTIPASSNFSKNLATYQATITTTGAVSGENSYVGIEGTVALANDHPYSDDSFGSAGGSFFAIANSASTISRLNGAFNVGFAASGDIDTLTGVSAAILGAGSGTTTNAIGANILALNFGGNVFTNAYGIKVEDIDIGSSTNYAIYTGLGKVRFGDSLQLTDGSATVPSLTFSGDTDTGFYRVNAGQIGITTNGIARFFINTTTFRSSGVGGISINNTNSQSATNPGYSIRGDENTGMYSDTADTLQWTTGGTLRMTLNSSGNFGIGSDSPLGKLEVRTGASGQSTVNTNADELVLNASGNGGLSILTPSTAFGMIAFGDEGAAAVGQIRYDHANNSFAFYTSGSERVRLDSSGRIGVGLTSPTAFINLKAGTASAGTAPLKFTAGTHLTTPEAGAMEFDGKTLFFTPSTARRAVNLSSDSKTSDTTVANTTTETTIYSTTLPANTLSQGKQIVIRSMGYYSTASASDVFTMRVKIGSTTIASFTTNGKNVTNSGFDVEGVLTIRSIGAGGTLIGMIKTEADTDTGISHATSTTAIDTTASNTFSITVQWGAADAGNTLTSAQGIARFLDGM